MKKNITSHDLQLNKYGTHKIDTYKMKIKLLIYAGTIAVLNAIKKTFQCRMSVFFNAYLMIGCLCYFLLTSALLPDIPLRPAGAI